MRDITQAALDQLPRVKLLDQAPPLQMLVAGQRDLWIKRDDLSASRYGGNKVRKLEYILADVQGKEQRKLLTFGAIGTNHGVATACYSQRLAINCEILLFDQPLTPKVQQNLRLMQYFGANLTYCGSLLRTALNFHARRSWQRDCYFLTAGGSSVLGCIAFVRAAFELAQQIACGEMPVPDTIVCAAGSLSTAAGLTLGCRLAGLPCQVVAVQVAPASVGPVKVCHEKKIVQLMRETMQYLVQKGVIAPVSLPKPILLHDYYGEGYGHATAAGQRATAVFAEQGIVLEQTYTAKAAAAALAICDSAAKETVLYWHTYNSVDLSAEADSVLLDELPERLRKWA